jgi:hypothetical protein
VVSEQAFWKSLSHRTTTIGRASTATDIAESILDRERELSGMVREESLETDVAPDLLDRESPTGEDLH